jgi:predicted permease
VIALVGNIAAPCLVFVTLVEVDLEIEALGRMALATMLTTAGFAVVGLLALKLAGLGVRAFLPAIVFPNTGNMGLPLCLLAFGDVGLALAIAYFTVSAAFLFTLGPAIAAGAANLSALARVPILYAVPAALAFTLTEVAVPTWVMNTVRLLGGMAIPLMLIALGISLAGLRVANLRRSVALSVLRLGAGFAVALAVAALLGLSPIEQGVLTVQSAMPVAVFTFLFAQRYQTEPAEVAGLVVISTALSFATLPALMAFVL